MYFYGLGWGSRWRRFRMWWRWLWPPSYWHAWQRWRNWRSWLAHRRRFPVVPHPTYVFEVPEL